MTCRFSRLVRLLTIPALLAMGVLTAPTASAGNPCFHGYEMPSTTTGAGTDIKLMPCAFDPTVTVIGVGETVNFINGPDYTHLVTGAAHEWGSAEVEVQQNQTVSYTFDKAGVYPYACALHPGMSGAIVVGDLADAVAAGVADSTAGGTTGTGTSEAAEQAAAEQAAAERAAEESSATAADPGIRATILVGIGIGAGLLAGIAVAWIALRRRPTSRPTTEGTLAGAE
jgi:plastocyanin